jgi:putative multiple sugar transport system permease protein
MFIFKGLLMLKTNNRTISTSNEFFNKIGIGYLTSIKIGGFDLISLIFGLSLIASLIIGSSLSRRKKKALGIPNERLEIFLTKMVFMSGIIFFLTYNLAIYKGLSYLLLITIIVVVIYFFITTQTVLGRRIYAVGGNPEAAELSGISVEKIIVFVFISMGILSLVSGIMYVSRTQNTSPNHGPFWELYAIAAAYIGGTSANGGFGKIVNAVIGSIVIMSLKNGMALAGVDANIEPIVLGSVLLLAVVFDIYTRNVRGADLVGMHYAKMKFKNDLIRAKQEQAKVKLELEKAKKDNKPNLLDYEYKYTNATAELAKIRELIRSAKEEDYIRA